MASRMSCPWFVGRTEELRQLIVALEATIAGSSAAVLVGGDAGIGKSRLVAELSKRARAGRRRRRHRALPRRRRRRARRTRRCTRCSPSSAQRRRAPARPAEALPAALRRVAAEHPVVLVIEDVHWADRSTRDLLTVLAGGPELSRRDAGGDVPRRRPGRVAIRCAACSPSSSAPSASSTSAWRRSAPATSPSSCAASSGRSRRTRWSAPCSSGPTATRSSPRSSPPSSGEGEHPARAPRAAPRPPRSPRQGCPAGRPGRRRRRAADRPPPPRRRRRAARPTSSTPACATARQHHLLLVDEQGYAFRHALVHEAVLGELLPGERTGLHAAFARAIDFDHALVGSAWAAALVHHWTAAGRSDRAIAPALAAAVDAELAYALPEAQRYYDWLLATLDDDDRRPRRRPAGVARRDRRPGRRRRQPRRRPRPCRPADRRRTRRARPAARSPRAPRSSTSGAAGACCSAAATTTPWRPTSRRSASSRPSPPTAARARVLAASADALERVDRPAARGRASGRGRRGGRRARDRLATRGTPGTPSAWRWRRPAISTGGLAELHRSLDLAVRGGDVADAAGIHRHLWRLVVAEGGAAELVDDDDRRRRDGPGRRAMPVLAGVLDAIAAGYCHQLGRWDEAEATARPPRPGTTRWHRPARRRRPRSTSTAATSSAPATASRSVRANTLGLRDGRLDGLLFRGLAERAWSRGHLGVVAAIVDEGICSARPTRS